MYNFHGPRALTRSNQGVNIWFLTINLSLFIFFCRSPADPATLSISYTLVSDLSIASLVLLNGDTCGRLLNYFRESSLLPSHRVLLISIGFVLLGRFLFSFENIIVGHRLDTLIFIVSVVYISDAEPYSTEFND